MRKRKARKMDAAHRAMLWLRLNFKIWNEMKIMISVVFSMTNCTESRNWMTRAIFHFQKYVFYCIRIYERRLFARLCPIFFFFIKIILHIIWCNLFALSSLIGHCFPFRFLKWLPFYCAVNDERISVERLNEVKVKLITNLIPHSGYKIDFIEKFKFDDGWLHCHLLQWSNSGTGYCIRSDYVIFSFEFISLDLTLQRRANPQNR